MSEAKQRCQLDGCNRAASTRCFCCNKNVCTRHFSEHIDAVKAQIDPLANDVNTMVEKIQSLTVERITEPSYAQLQQWKMDMHQLIDEIFLAKTKELENLIEKNKQKFDEHKKQQLEIIMKVQDEVRQLAEDGDATYEQIQILKNKLTTVETSLASFEKDFVSVNTKVLVQGLVTISSFYNPASSSTTSNSSTTSTVFPVRTTRAPVTTIPSNVGFGVSSVTATTTSPRFSFAALASTTTTTPFGTGFGTSTTATPAASTGFFGTTTTPSSSPFSFGTAPVTSTTSNFGTTNTTSSPFGALSFSFQSPTNPSGSSDMPSANPFNAQHPHKK